MIAELGRGDPCVAEDLLHYADVHALLDEERGGCRAPGRLEPRLSEDGFPQLPILGALDRCAVSDGEHEVVMHPAVAGPFALACPFALAVLNQVMFLEPEKQRGRAKRRLSDVIWRAPIADRHNHNGETTKKEPPTPCT